MPIHTVARRLYRDERGMSFVFVGMGFTAFLAATTLAVDVGMFMNARSQAQVAADAGALAGATALAFNDFNNRSSSGPAVQNAVHTAMANKVMGKTVSITPGDVTFPTAPSGASNRVAVQVFRDAGHGNAVPTMMGALFGVQTVNIVATATAEASPANAMTCVKPFMIPDRWDEKRNPAWTTSSTYDAYSNKGVPLEPADLYIGANDVVNYTGYTTAKDRGTRLTLRAGTGGNINPSFYYSWKMPGDTGGDFYRENIANCNSSVMHWGELIVQEPGNMVGPTVDGIVDLIAKDPGAYWDDQCDCVKGSAYPISPRVFPIPLYDPEYYALGKAHGRDADFRIANFLGFFAEPPIGNSIPGVITQIVGIVDLTSGPAPAAAFPVSIRLVQ